MERGVGAPHLRVDVGIYFHGIVQAGAWITF